MTDLVIRPLAPGEEVFDVFRRVHQGSLDQVNFPIAAGFAKAGHPIVQERIDLI